MRIKDIKERERKIIEAGGIGLDHRHVMRADDVPTLQRRVSTVYQRLEQRDGMK
jgi:hypothetical protein